MEVVEGSTETDHVHSWGESIPVESVQELGRRGVSFVPDKYMRTTEDMSLDRMWPHLSSEIPVIDLSLLAIRCENELMKLDLACQTWGFFQIINHGVAEELLQNMKTAAADFFRLPLEEKKRYAMPSNDVQGYGQVHVVSREQRLDWSDGLVLLIYPSMYRKSMYWPTCPLDFKEIVEKYSSEVNRVAAELLSCLSVALGFDQDVLLALHREMLQVMRVNFYPTCCRPEAVLGVSPHSDSSTITILLQDNDVTGLQIRHDSGWVPVEPMLNALVVNVGDVIEILSNGKYKSIEHRAVPNKNKVRMSIASFLSPVDDVEIGPLDPGVKSGQHPRLYKKVKYGEYLRNSIKRKLDGKSHIEFAKLEE